MNEDKWLEEKRNALLQVRGPQVSHKTLSERTAHCRVWQEERILNCTERCARVLMRHHLMIQSKLKSDLHFVGVGVLYWEPGTSSELNLIMVARAGGAEILRFRVAPKSKVVYQEEVYQDPSALIEKLAVDRHFFIKPIVLDPQTAVGRLLLGCFDASCPIASSDDPASLLQIALANQDFRSALFVLEHPQVQGEGDRSTPNRPLVKTLKVAAMVAIDQQSQEFLNYLICKYNILNAESQSPLFLLEHALKNKNDRMVNYLLDVYPDNIKPDAYGLAIFFAAQLGNCKRIAALLQDKVSLIKLNEERKLPFMQAIFEGCGAEFFLKAISALGWDIPWIELISRLVSGKASPYAYLSRFVESGGRVADLPADTKHRLMVAMLEGADSLAPLEKLIDDFPGLGVIDAALINDFITDKTRLNLLIDHGIEPAASNFEKLLQRPDIASERQIYFEILLNGIKSPESAKSSLAISSAFGKSAVDRVWEKFPALKTDPDFLVRLMQDVWKGMQYDLLSLQNDLLKVKSDSRTQTPVAALASDSTISEELSVPIETLAEQAEKSPELAINIIFEVLLPKKAFEKIKFLLLKANELSIRFWSGCSYRGPESLDSTAWRDLALSSVPALSSEEKAAILRESFKYGHTNLARLLVDAGARMPEHLAFDLLRLGIRSGESKLARLIIDAGLSEARNEKGETLLHVAVEENHAGFLEALMEKDCRKDIPDFKGVTPLMIAEEGGKATLCRILEGRGFFTGMAKKLLKNTPAAMEHQFYKIFLNSSSIDTAELLECTMKTLSAEQFEPDDKEKYSVALKRVSAFISTSGTLILRFPSKRHQEEMHEFYGMAYPNYEEQQVTWGNYREEVFHEVSRKARVEKWPLMKVFQGLAKPRENQTGFHMWRLNYLKSMCIQTPMLGRYYQFWVIGLQMYRKLSEKPELHTEDLHKTTRGYTVMHKLKSGETIPLADIKIIQGFYGDDLLNTLIHAKSKEAVKVLGEMSEIYEDLKITVEKKKELQPSEELERKIAYFYWLGCHATVTDRGNSQYMLELHRLLYQEHGYYTSPWSQTLPQPDCVALVLPFSEFYPNYYRKLFEKPPSCRPFCQLYTETY